MRFDYSDAFVQTSDEKMTRRVLAHSENLMLAHLTFHKKSDDPGLHSHPHEQIIFLEKGKIEFIMDGESSVLGVGDSVYVPPNVIHGVRILEDNCILLDIFTPRRDDFLK